MESRTRELAEENERAEPLSPVTPVAPHAATECVGISPVGRWYAAALKYLGEEEALKPNMGPGGDIVGTRAKFWKSAVWSGRRASKEPRPFGRSPRPYSTQPRDRSVLGSSVL
jgi:hypothetical protein